jgi:hypothetical protein
MADPQIVPLTDEELQWVAQQKDPALLGKLTSEERRRLGGLQIAQLPVMGAWMASPGAAPGAKQGAIQTANMAPAILGGVGAVVGGPPGAGVGGAVGSLVKQSVNAATGTTTAPVSPGGAAWDVAKNAGLQYAAEGIGEALPAAMQGGARMVYRGYLKPSLAKAGISKAGEIVDTALGEALPISQQGAATADALASGLQRQVESVLAETDGKVDLKAIADRVRSWAKATYYKAGESTANYDAAMAVADRIDRHPSLARTVQQPTTRTVQTGILDAAGAPITRTEQTTTPVTTYQRTVSPLAANDTKIALRRNVDFGVPGASATKAAQKVGGYETRQAIETLSPSVGPLNAREGRLLDAAKAINKAVGREANQNAVTGAKTLESAAVGAMDYVRSGNPYAATTIALATRLGLNAEQMSRAAIVAYRLGSGSGLAPGVIAQAAVQAAVSESQQNADHVAQ